MHQMNIALARRDKWPIFTHRFNDTNIGRMGQDVSQYMDNLPNIAVVPNINHLLPHLRRVKFKHRFKFSKFLPHIRMLLSPFTELGKSCLLRYFVCHEKIFDLFFSFCIQVLVHNNYIGWNFASLSSPHNSLKCSKLFLRTTSWYILQNYLFECYYSL